MPNILEVLSADKNLSTMMRIIKAAEMEALLAQTGPFTIFAPSEIAFGKLAGGEKSAFLKPENRTKLTTIIKNHIVQGKMKISDLLDGQKLKTLSGNDLEVTVAKELVIVSGSTVQGHDFEASNGVVHSIDKILMPPVPATAY